MEKLTLCKGCFTEWNELNFQCFWCGWCPDMETGERKTKTGWELGKVLERRYLLGNIYLRTNDGYTVWRAYDRHLDIKCFFLTTVNENVHWLAKIAWGFEEHSESGVKILGLREIEGRYALVFSMKNCFLPIEEFREMVHPRDENPFPLIGRVRYQIDPASKKHVLPADHLLGKRYRIIGCLGIGGFGILYLCEDILLQRNVTVKEYFPEQWAEREGIFAGSRSSETLEAYRYGLSSFLEEAKITAKFIHVDHVVTVYDVFMENDTAYLVMEYICGKNIEREFQKWGFRPYRPHEAAEILIPVLEALEEIHKQKILHGDLSLGNLMRTTKGDVILIDFGAAKEYGSDHANRRPSFLKPDYAAPEQFRLAQGGEVQEGPWTDIYAVGVMLYFLITGHKPADAQSRMAVRSSDLAAPKQYNVKVKKGWMRLIHQCVELEKKKRISSCRAVREELQHLLKHEKEGS